MEDPVGLNGFESLAKKYKKDVVLWEVLDFAARAGFDGVELVANWPMGPYPAAAEADRIRALRRLYDGFGLQIFSLQLHVAEAFAPDAEVQTGHRQDRRPGGRALMGTLRAPAAGLLLGNVDGGSGSGGVGGAAFPGAEGAQD